MTAARQSNRSRASTTSEAGEAVGDFRTSVDAVSEEVFEVHAGRVFGRQTGEVNLSLQGGGRRLAQHVGFPVLRFPILSLIPDPDPDPGYN